MKNCLRTGLQLTAAVALVAMLMATLSGCFIFDLLTDTSSGSYTPDYSYSEPAPMLSDLAVSRDYMVQGLTYELTFTVTAADPTGAVELWLRKTDGTADVNWGTMTDDGTGGDATAYDGVYTRVMTVTADNVGTHGVYVACGSESTPLLNITVYAVPTEAELAATEETAQRFSRIDAELGAEENGGLDPSLHGDALDLAEAHAAMLVESGEAVDYFRDDYSVTVVMANGIEVVYSPSEPETDGAPTPDTEMSVFTLQPFDNQYGHTTARNMMDYPDDAAYTLDTSLANYTFAGDYDNHAVTPEALRGFGANQVILWHGHGGYNERHHSYLLTTVPFNAASISKNGVYYEYLLSGGLIVSGSHLCMTYRFIDQYCGSMDNTFVYLAACHSGQDDVLANAFLAKGAEAVVANMNSIATVYNLTMQNAVVKAMAAKDVTGNYPNVMQAMNGAMAAYGQDDAGYIARAGRVPAYPMIFGDGYYCFADANAAAATAAPETPAPVTPEPATPQPTEPPSPQAMNDLAHANYAWLLENYAWVAYSVPDMSEITPDQYSEMWLGDYYLVDIDGDGVDELIIYSGTSVAGMGYTVFTFKNGALYCAGGHRTSEAWLYAGESGIMTVYMRGGYGLNTYYALNGTELAVAREEDFSYSELDIPDPQPAGYYHPTSYSVHDTTPLQ